MRIEFSTEGGIAFLPGLARPVTIDTDSLAPEQARRLTELVEAADFFARPAQVGQPPPGAADMQRHIVAIQDGARRHRVAVAEPIEDPALAALMAALRPLVDAARRAR
ncbi:protealysin inhibitor emfourin [Haliangium sp.]|uniref:protealysin inhibitor emfourin n=1 Tax=Haliangium sp. TaxID=2663208 RepID=UPI003D0D134F